MNGPGQMGRTLRARSSAPGRGTPDGATYPLWLPLIPAILLIALGFIRLHEVLPYAYRPSYAFHASGQLAWSDIAYIYGRPNLSGHPLPYANGHHFEYPVLTGLVFLLIALADVAYYIAIFQYLHLGFALTRPSGAAVTSWDLDHVLMPVVVFRELAFLVLIAWIVRTCLWRPARETRASTALGVAVGRSGVR